MSVVDPYAGEVIAQTRSTGSGCIAAYMHKYGSAKLPFKLTDGQASAVYLDELPEPESDAC